MGYTWSLAKPMSQFLMVLSIESNIWSEFFLSLWMIPKTNKKQKKYYLVRLKNYLAENQPIVYELKKTSSLVLFYSKSEKSVWG